MRYVLAVIWAFCLAWDVHGVYQGITNHQYVYGSLMGLLTILAGCMLVVQILHIKRGT